MGTTNTPPSAPVTTVRATILLDLPFALSQDINTLWLRKTAGQVATLAAEVGATDTSFTLRAPPAQSLVDLTVLLDNEPCQVTAQSADGSTLTVLRFAAAFPYMTMLPSEPTTTHAAGSPILQVLYPTPWVYISESYLRPAVQSDVISLGAASKTFGTAASGSLGPTPTS